ncbi:MAG: hypothetical protein ACI9R3_002813 [Verrucomicrobiales bacterium]|jgi:hypothetical protein
MKRHKHIWEAVVSWDNLVAASGKAMLGKRSRPPAAAAFFRDWEKELCALSILWFGHTFVAQRARIIIAQSKRSAALGRMMNEDLSLKG